MTRLLKVGLVGALIVLTAACCTKAPKEVGDATAALNDLKASCASAYAADCVAQAQGMLDQANDLVANKKCRDAKAKALELVAKAKDCKTASDAEQAAAKGRAENAIASAKAAIAAAQAAQAPQYAATTFQRAKDALAEAEGQMGQPCNYYKALEAANRAKELADRAKKEAEDEIARLKAEEERRRLEAQRALDAKPTSYTVAKGDCLWKISAKKDIYENPFLWPLIWDANRGLIKDHPDLIYPNWVFKINREYTDVDAKRAEKTARHHKWEPAAPAAPKDVKTTQPETPAPAPAPAK